MGALTSLRGVAALIVVVFHFDKMIVVDWPSHSTAAFIEKGYLMVDLFFVLSGFIMVHVYGHSFVEERPTRRSVTRFLEARFARIYPLHLFVLMLWVALELARYSIGSFASSAPDPLFSWESTSPRALVSNLLLVQALHLHRDVTWNGPSWSISAEWWTYLFFPFLVGTFYLGSKAGRIALAMLLMVLLAGLTQLTPANRLGPLDLTVDYGFFRCVFEFFLGVLTYRAYSSPAVRDRLSHDWVFLLSVLWIAVVMQHHAHDLIAVPGFVLLVATSASNTHNASWVLNLPPLRLLGEISYSIYMTHTFVREIATLFARHVLDHPEGTSPILDGGVSTLAGLVLVVVTVSYCTWRVVERPSREYIRRLTMAGR